MGVFRSERVLLGLEERCGSYSWPSCIIITCCLLRTNDHGKEAETKAVVARRWWRAAKPQEPYQRRGNDSHRYRRVLERRARQGEVVPVRGAEVQRVSQIELSGRDLTRAQPSRYAIARGESSEVFGLCHDNVPSSTHVSHDSHKWEMLRIGECLGGGSALGIRANRNSIMFGKFTLF